MQLGSSRSCNIANPGGVRRTVQELYQEGKARWQWCARLASPWSAPTQRACTRASRTWPGRRWQSAEGGQPRPAAARASGRGRFLVAPSSDSDSESSELRELASPRPIHGAVLWRKQYCGGAVLRWKCGKKLTHKDSLWRHLAQQHSLIHIKLLWLIS